MCGITLILRSRTQITSDSMIFHSKSQSVPIFSEETIRGMIHPRGPDCFTSQTFESVTLGTIQMYGALLSLRGLPTPIPYETLLWNGEVFGGSVTVPVDENDTVHVLEHLRSTDESDIVAAMSAIEGPYAFCYYDSRSNCLWFGRDPMGRRSLLCCLTDNTLVLSSVALDAAQVSSGQQTKSAFFELPVDSLFSLRPNADESTLVLSAHRRDVHIPALRSAELPFKQAFGAKLRDSVRRRVVNIPLPPLSAACGDNICRLAVLFSGGIDCTILAYLCDAFVPSGEVIDLLNVSFAEQDYDSAPDRQTALQSLQELQSRCPERRFRLIRVNVSAVAFAAHTKRIFELILPRNSLLDFNLASALYFASRGHGVDADGQPVSTSARVLISGLGSDELLAGYGRHRTAFMKGGKDRLASELQLDFDRLWVRNLGRDDRVISEHGREVRFPFLDAQFVSFVRGLDLDDVCDFSLKPGTGDKKILRDFTRACGLEKTAPLVKRALQFGSRIAKVSHPRAEGNHLVQLSEDGLSTIVTDVRDDALGDSE